MLPRPVPYGAGMPSRTPYRRLSRRVRALPRLVARAPGWLLVVLGAATTVLGVVLAVRPLSSLTVLAVYTGASCVLSGVGDLLARRDGDGRSSVLTGIGWVLAGVAVLVCLGRSLQLLGPFVSGLLVVTGLVRLSGLRRGPVTDRLLAGASGLAELAFGLVAWVWPDATLLVVALLFGVRTAGLGLSLVWRGARAARPGPTNGRGAPRSLRWAAAVGVLVVAAAALVLSVQFRAGIPVLDGF